MPTTFLKRDIRIQLFNIIESTNIFERLAVDQRLTDFIIQIWPIDTQKSTDYRFKTLYQDIKQHYENNRDGSWYDLFVDQLDLISNSINFKKFLEEIIKPTWHDAEQIRENLIKDINTILIPNNFIIKITNLKQKGRPIYSLTENEPKDTIKKNTIPFYLKYIGDSYNNIQYPSFSLVLNKRWNDYGMITSFYLYFCDNSKTEYELGSLKIINNIDIVQYSTYNYKYSIDSYIPKSFTILPDQFCSLGMEEEYYQNIKHFFPNENESESILWALKDCAIFSQLQEEFDNLPQWEISLLRTKEAVRLLREAKFILKGIDINNHYKFIYKFQPKYSPNTINIDFDFNKNGNFPRRIYGLIGKNGVGKTQLITTLPFKLALKDTKLFIPSLPIYSKIIAISNSYYDNFEIPNNNGTFNYNYIGLSQRKNYKKEIKSPQNIEDSILEATQKILQHKRILELKEILSIILNHTYVDGIIETNTDPNLDSEYKFNEDNIINTCRILSSGECSLFYIFTNLIAYIQYDSLLLFDEIETHLHPNAITKTMNAIYTILDKYDSYAIIATHSPLIIREMKSDSVYIMNREEDICDIKKISIESLGADTTTLIDEIFGNKDIQEYYKRSIIKMKDDGLSKSEIIHSIQSSNTPISLNMALFIEQLFISTKNEKN